MDPPRRTRPHRGGGRSPILDPTGHHNRLTPSNCWSTRPADKPPPRPALPRSTTATTPTPSVDSLHAQHRKTRPLLRADRRRSDAVGRARLLLEDRCAKIGAVTAREPLRGCHRVNRRTLAHRRRPGRRGPLQEPPRGGGRGDNGIAGRAYAALRSGSVGSARVSRDTVERAASLWETAATLLEAWADSVAAIARRAGKQLGFELRRQPPTSPHGRPTTSPIWNPVSPPDVVPDCGVPPSGAALRRKEAR